MSLEAPRNSNLDYWYARFAEWIIAEIDRLDRAEREGR